MEEKEVSTTWLGGGGTLGGCHHRHSKINLGEAPFGSCVGLCPKDILCVFYVVWGKRTG